MKNEGNQIMLRLNPKEIDLVQDAVLRFGTSELAGRWAEWLRDNPIAAGERLYPPLSRDLARLILRVLQSYNRSASAQIRGGMYDEDAVADIGNDLIVAEAVLSDIARELGMGTHPH